MLRSVVSSQLTFACILVDATVANANIAPQGLKLLFSDFDNPTRDNTLVSFLGTMAVGSCC